VAIIEPDLAIDVTQPDDACMRIMPVFVIGILRMRKRSQRKNKCKNYGKEQPWFAETFSAQVPATR
jgi:hypothetical protein